MNFSPTLSDDFPCRARVLAVFKQVANNRVGQACRAGILGTEIAEMALKAEAFDNVLAQDESLASEKARVFLNAMDNAIGIAMTSKAA